MKISTQTQGVQVSETCQDHDNFNMEDVVAGRPQLSVTRPPSVAARPLTLAARPPQTATSSIQVKLIQMPRRKHTFIQRTSKKHKSVTANRHARRIQAVGELRRCDGWPPDYPGWPPGHPGPTWQPPGHPGPNCRPASQPT